jgi:Restriction endonuclease S subunits
VFASYLIRLSVDKNKLLPKYVYHYFQSRNYWEQISKGISGAAQGGFNASKLGGLQIPIIGMKEQTEITLKLDKIFYETFSLMRLYQNKIKLLKSLKSSVLLKELNNKAA